MEKKLSGKSEMELANTDYSLEEFDSWVKEQKDGWQRLIRLMRLKEFIFLLMRQLEHASRFSVRIQRQGENEDGRGWGGM